MAALHAGPVTVEDRIVRKMLWHRAKDVPDVHALIATTEDLLRPFGPSA